MTRRKKLGPTLALAILFSLLTFTSLTQFTTQSAQAAPPAGTVIYNLYGTDGYVTMADGERIYTYGFIGGRQTAPATPFKYLDNNGVLQTIPGGVPAPTGGSITAAEQPLAGNAQFPAPAIWATTRDVVEIRLKNLGVNANPEAPNDPHSIHLHGLDVDAANDGVPETSVGAVPANSTDPGAGNVVVYMFAPKYPGTYMYHCHQEADIHVQMGMYGALVVYNQNDPAALTGPGTGRGGNLYGWTYDQDYVMLLSEFDTRQHDDEEGTYEPQSWDPDEWNPVDYDPQYWFINGLSFPNTVHVNTPGFSWADWIQAYPNYDPLITGSVTQGGTRGQPGNKILIRMINMGFETQPMHMHGFHGKVLGSDQRAWSWAQPLGPNTAFGTGLEKNTITIGSGETYEWLIDMGQQKVTSTYPGAGSVPPSTFPGGTQSRYDLTTNLPVSNGVIAQPGIPGYIPGPVVSGTALGPGTSQFFPFHNHDDYKATNNGAYPGGMFTMIVPLP